MNREALTRLRVARNMGMSREAVAKLYEHLVRQIENVADDWRAKRAPCQDGSVAFLGSVHVLVVHETGVYVGKIGGLLKLQGGGYSPALKVFVYPPPDLTASEKRVA